MSRTLTKKLAEIKAGTLYVGVDLALDRNEAVVLDERARQLGRIRFPNDREGYDYFRRRLEALREQHQASAVLVGMEPTNYFFADDLREKLAELLAPLEWLEQQLKPLLQGLDAPTPAFLVWTWQHRHALNLDRDIPETLRSVVRDVWDTLGLFHRSSSLVESLHSGLRPYLQIHRGMPKWLLPLLQLFWNHHPFERGKRAGSSPLQLAGVENAPSLAQVAHQLFWPDATAQTA